MTRIRQYSPLMLVLATFLALAGCGGGGATPRFATPTGPFTKADLSGAYAFSMTGSNSFGLFIAAGSFQADGNGNVTSGQFDFNSLGGIFTQVPTSGIYAVSPDGRGNLVLNSQVATLDVDFVLTSSQHGLLVRFDSNASASGTLDRQDATAFSTAALHGPFVFNLGGTGAVGSVILQSAGVFSADGAGHITAGVADENDSGAAAAALALSGSYAVGADGRGTMQLIDSQRTLNLAFYLVDATHFKLVETDGNATVGGDAYSQQGAISDATLNGGYAFTVGGMSTAGPYAAGGVFTADGAGHIASGVEDVNNAGQVSANLPVTSGAYVLGANGRGTMTLGTSAGIANFAIYPSTGGLQIIQMDSTVVSGGAAFARPPSPAIASITGPYAYNLTGAFNGGAIDSIAQFTADGAGKLAGAVDYNLSGSLPFNLKLDGTYSVAGNGRGTLALRNTSLSQNLAIYVAGSRVLFVDLDGSIIAVGDFEPQ